MCFSRDNSCDLKQPLYFLLCLCSTYVMKQPLRLFYGMQKLPELTFTAAVLPPAGRYTATASHRMDLLGCGSIWW